MEYTFCWQKHPQKACIFKTEDVPKVYHDVLANNDRGSRSNTSKGVTNLHSIKLSSMNSLFYLKHKAVSQNAVLEFGIHEKFSSTFFGKREAEFLWNNNLR